MQSNLSKTPRQPKWTACILIGMGIACSARAQDPIDYRSQVQPGFDEHGVRCHGDQKQMGKLRLDSLEGLQAKLAQKTEQVPELPLPDVPRASDEGLQRVLATGAQVLSLFDGSPLLDVSFAFCEKPADDHDLRALEGIADQVVSLNLTKATASESGYVSLAKLQHLRKLHLERSSITDAGLKNLASLSSLQYLNLYGTNITDAGLPYSKDLSQLRRLYLWQSEVSFDAAMVMMDHRPGLEVDLGFDHPLVVKRRVTDQIQRLTEQHRESQAAVEAIQRQLEGAKKQADLIQSEIGKLKKLLENQPDKPAGHQATGPAEPSAPDEKKVSLRYV